MVDPVDVTLVMELFSRGRSAQQSNMMYLLHYFDINTTAKPYTARGLHPQTLITILPSTGQNQCYVNILLYKTSVISIMVSHFDYKHRYLIEKNAPIALILPSRWQYGAESLRMSALDVYGLMLG